MTDDMMNLRTLVEKAPDADLTSMKALGLESRESAAKRGAEIHHALSDDPCENGVA